MRPTQPSPENARPPAGPSSLREFARRLDPARVYLWLAAVFGVAVLFANPPFQAPDEYMHYFRIHQFATGHLFAEKQAGYAGGWIPIPASDIASPGDIPGNPDRKVSAEVFAQKARPLFCDWSATETRFERFPHTSIYAPTAYWAQVGAVKLGKLLHFGPLLLLYTARLASLATSVLLVFAALRLLPANRWLSALLLLAPTALYFYGSCAPDGLLISSSFYLVARLARARADGVVPGPLGLLGLIFLGGAISTAKFVYFPLAALVPVALWSLFPAPRARWLFLAAWVALCLVPTAWWAHIMSTRFTVTREDIPIDPHAQLRHMLAHPFAFAWLTVRTYAETAGHLAQSIVGVLGWNDTPMPQWFYAGFGVMLGAACFLDRDAAPRRDWIGATLGAGAALAVFALIAAGLYAQWNSPGSRELIDGLVGRYLFPALPALALAVPVPARLRVPAPWAHVLGAALAGLSVTVCLYAVLIRFYAF